MRRSKVIARLKADKPVMMVNISMGVNPMAVEMAGKMGAHAVWLDMEHRSFTWQDVQMLIMAARLGDVDATVRVRKQEGYATIHRPLQEGAGGIIVPHVRSAKEAATWVEYGKFAPVGRRGFENVMPDADLGMADSTAYMKHANTETFITLQIEDVEAVEAADEIASVPGFDVIFVGPGDLSVGYGVTGETRHPKVMKAIEKVAAAAANHGKQWGLPVMNMTDAKTFADMGGRFFACGGDYGWILRGMKQARDEFEAAFGLDV